MEENDYISLVEATKYCKYSQEYLSLRARQGKLKAVKRGRNWFTTKQWLNEYTSNFDDYLSARRSGLYRISRKQTRRPAQGKIDSLAIKRRFVIALAGIGLLAFATGGFTAIHLSDIIFQKQESNRQKITKTIEKTVSSFTSHTHAALSAGNSAISDALTSSVKNIGSAFCAYSSDSAQTEE